MWLSYVAIQYFAGLELCLNLSKDASVATYVIFFTATLATVEECYLHNFTSGV